MSSTDGWKGDATFTKLPHDLLDRDAVLLLSHGAFRVMVDFLRLWLRETRNGRRRVPAGVPFTFGGCSWPVKECTWNGYRSELVDRGFLTCVHRRRGYFAWSESYKARPLSADARRRFERHARRQEKRRLSAMCLRRNVGGAPPEAGGTPAPGNGGAGAPLNGRGTRSPETGEIFIDQTPRQQGTGQTDLNSRAGAGGRAHD